jgi:hypothetical protein
VENRLAAKPPLSSLELPRRARATAKARVPHRFAAMTLIQAFEGVRRRLDPLDLLLEHSTADSLLALTVRDEGAAYTSTRGTLRATAENGALESEDL